MDTKIKKACPSCSQLYFIRSVSPKVSNIPLFLSCGHSMCESCITSIVKFEEPVDCKICQRDTKLSKAEATLVNEKKEKLYQFFPVNYAMLGELVFQILHASNQGKKENDNFIDLKAIMANSEDTIGKCLECHKQTAKMCQQCATALCDHCFNKSHKNFIIFKNHVLVNIDQVLVPNDCKIHKGKPLDYYCKDCKKSICMDCLMVGGEKSCKNHNVVSMQEVNDNLLEEIIDITPKVDETFRRLTKTAVDVGYLLNNIENDTGSSSDLTKMLASVEQHFSKIISAILKHQQEVVNIIVKLKCSEKESLHKAKEELESSIKKAKRVLNNINSFSNPKKSKQYNLSVLLDDAKQIVGSPWYLSRDESNDPLKVAVNEDLCTLVSDYIHLEGNANSVYKLCNTAELGEGGEVPPPPSAPVYPPELPRDVRMVKEEKSVAKPATAPTMFCKRAPSYHIKSGSVSSLNSINSDSSDKPTFSLFGDNSQKPVIQPVQPFSESQHPKQLHEGSQEIIYITHIVDPHNFFVQRACHQSLVKDMQREFRNAASMPRPSLSHVAEGKTYLMFSKADNMWQRCRVLGINKKDANTPTVLVFCIDFGNTETVSIDKLRLLPPARVQSPYPLATNCSLANCEPRAGSWTSDDAYLIQSIVDNKQAIIHVRAIRQTAAYCARLEVDVTTFEEGVSLAHALAFHERARMPTPRLHYPKILGAMQRPKIFMTNNDLKPKTVEEVYITLIISPDKFYVTKRHVKSIFEKLCDDLDQEYSLNSNVGLVYQPEIGMSVVAYVDNYRDGAPGWARGVVQGLPGRSRVTLLLPDTGHTALLHWTKLRHIRHEHTITRALANECHLAGVTPLNKKWSAGSVALLKRFEERPLELHVEDVRRGSAGATLYDRADSDSDNVVCVNNEMIKYKYAVSFGLFMFNRNSDIANQPKSGKTPLDAKPSTSQSNQPGQLQVLNKQTDKVNDQQLDAKDKGPLRLEAKILYYQSPSLLYLSLVHQQKAFNDLYEKLQKHYSEKKSPGKEQWSVGDRCVTHCAQSRTFRRAAILELNDDKAKVFYSDFACVETVPTATLMESIAEFAGYGDAAIQCHLCGIVPADGSDEWPTITKEYLKELLDVYPRIFITKLGNFKNKSMPIEIWVYHTIQGGALEPNKSEWRCLNKKIIEQGLGIPDKTQQMSTGPETSQDDMLSFLKNVTGSVDEWLQLEPLPTKPLTSLAKPEDSAISSPVDEDEEEPEDGKADTVFISDWLPPEPLASAEFNAMPTYIDNDGVIYLHDMRQEDTLDLIRKALDVRFKNPDPKAKFHKWAVGEPCIALFFLDNKYYRGRVVEVNNDNSTCLINYVDYGNEELCSFLNMRKSIALYQIPVQAHRCVLARVRPPAGRWDRNTLDYLHKSTVEKCCFVKVAGDPVDGIIPIDLKYDKLWINDHLVDFEMAVFTDGSKPIVRKFSTPAAPRDEPIVVDDSSGPDYIIIDDESVANSSFKSLEGKDWNQILEEEERRSRGRFVEFSRKELPPEFACNITVINECSVLELNLMPSDEEAARYSCLEAELQSAGPELPPLDGIFVDKACLALFPDDGLWYRAVVLESSESDDRIKVRYVDYGNIEVIPSSSVREITAELAELPPATVRARIAGYYVDPDADLRHVSQEYERIFIDRGPFNAKVIDHDDDVVNVELYTDAGDLVYHEFIENKLFLPVSD